MNILQRIKDSSFLLITHEYATGPTHALEEYLATRVRTLVFLSHPFVFAKNPQSYIHVYSDGKIREHRFPFHIPIQILNILKDMLVTFYVGLRHGPFDYVVAADSVNALSAIVLKNVGRTHFVVYHTIDYVPIRFHNRLLDRLYIKLDQWAVKYSDVVWNLSDVMVTEREKYGLRSKYRSKQLRVPMGTDADKRKKPDSSKVHSHHIVHMGHIVKEHGVQLIIESLPQVLEKVPDVHLHIIGSGPYLEELKDQARLLGVGRSVTFHGFVKKHEDVLDLLATSAVGIATYPDTPTSFIRNSDPGKVKAYLSAGLPVIVTKVPEVWKELEKNACGVGISYDAAELSSAIIRLIGDEKRLRKYRTNAWTLATKLSWSNVIQHAFAETFKLHD